MASRLSLSPDSNLFGKQRNRCGVNEASEMHINLRTWKFLTLSCVGGDAKDNKPVACVKVAPRGLN